MALAALELVELVVIFADDIPLGLIEALAPDVLVKGADYSADQVVGRDLSSEMAAAWFSPSLNPAIRQPGPLKKWGDGLVLSGWSGLGQQVAR